MSGTAPPDARWATGADVVGGTAALAVDGRVRTFVVGAFFEVDDAGLVTRGRVYREGTADLA